METARKIEQYDARTQSVLELATHLIEIPSISQPPSKENPEGINEAYLAAKEFALESDLNVIDLPADQDHPYPFLILTFKDDDQPESFDPKIALVGHLDVVAPQEPNQFTPQIEDDMLIGRGSADMKTVVATQMVWMAEQQAKPGPKPPVVTMISFTEENGSIRPYSVKEAIDHLKNQHNKEVELAIVGERTGEIENMGKVPVGPICNSNRGWRWYRAEQTAPTEDTLKLFSTIASQIEAGRRTIDQHNNSPSSPQMEKQDNWRTSFVNPFLVIENPEIPQEGHQLVFTKAGTPRHSAIVPTSETTLTETFKDTLERAQKHFGEEHVSLNSVNIGEDHNYNTVTGGGEMVLTINAPMQLIPDWMTLESEQNPETTITLKPLAYKNAETPSTQTASPNTFGLDIRELPEHAAAINSFIAETRELLSSHGVDLKTVNEGDSWTCPPDNPHYQKLRQAYESVMGEPSPESGKLHGNDGRFFKANAVVFGQTGFGPHKPTESHYIPSIPKYLEILDQLAK